MMTPKPKPWKPPLVAALLASFAAPAAQVAAETEAKAKPPSRIRAYVETHCLDCHDGDRAKGGLDLSRLGLDLGNRQTFATWVKVHDRVRAGEMPPATSPRPPRRETTGFLTALADPLVATDLAREVDEGRATRRRLNRHEYEQTLRELFAAPWLQIKDILPEDGEAHRFNKVGDALDVSHVQLAQYLEAADHAIREVLIAQAERPTTTKTRYYARENRAIALHMLRTGPGTGHVRSAFPVLGTSADLPIIQARQKDRRAPVTVGEADPVKRDLEGVGFIHSTYEPLELKFERFKAPRAGRYRLRLMAHAVWVGAQKGPQWWNPDMSAISPGRRPEPITLYGERPPSLLRRLGAFDARPEPTVGELEVYLLAGETIRPDAGRFVRSRPARVPGRPPGSSFRSALATPEGQPGISYRWLEVEGPLVDAHPAPGPVLLFGDLPVKIGAKGTIEVASTDPKGDARRLMETFVRRAYRRPVDAKEIDAFVALVDKALGAGAPFADAMITGYQAVLCSPAFVYLDEAPGPLDDWALASRLSYFLWNSPPDEALRAAAGRGELARPGALRAQAARLLDDPRSRRFVDAFLDYWIDLRRVGATSPDAVLYADYNLDDLLVESAAQETQLFFTELLRKDLPARNLVASDFVFANERLAAHYGLPTGKLGVALEKVPVPKGSPRGGLLTQASVLKVTANGTTTSPVLRGVWINERLLGLTVPPPPPGTPAVEPDIRGAQTIRAQLEKHRADKTCASCHTKIDPAGFALESFDVFGGFRTRYRALGEGPTPTTGIGKDGIRYEFHEALPVDPSGTLPDGSKFRDVFDLKRLLLRDERQLARNLVHQLVVFATGAPVRFGDRARVEEILDRAAPRRYGVRTLALQIVESELFRAK